jgi:5,10-methylene-tetrahydrofolate dehydrogenase/methenyl tetrahydrofolate cyclohydrolase
MMGQIINGKEIALKIRKEISEKIHKIKNENNLNKG